MSDPTEKTFWKVDKDPHGPIFSTLHRLKRSLDARNNRWQRFVGSFLNGRAVHGFKPGDLEETDLEVMKRVKTNERKLVMNPSENCIAALAARIASQRPRASFLVETEGPDAWSVNLRARGLEKAVAGEWYRAKFYRRTQKVFIQSGGVGFGGMHIYPGEEHVCFEATSPWEFIVDEAAAINGETRTLMREKWTPLEVAIARFCSNKWPSKMRDANQRAIEKAVSDSGTIRAGYKVITNLVRLIEAWHLPSGWGAEDGRHVICVQGRTLTPKEEWEWPFERFPFAFFPWSQPIIGWYPQGLMERAEPLQGQLNKFLGRVQDAMHMHAVARTFYEEGTINKEHLTNSPKGSMIPVKKGTRLMPTTQMPNSMSAELIRMIPDIRAWIFEEQGVSQLSAASVRPAGIESGKGLLVLRDSESGRFALLNETWDDMHVDAAELTVMAMRQIAERRGDYSVGWPGQGRLERINFKDVDLERDSYLIQVFPSSMLPHEPAGRFEQVERLLEKGFVNQPQAQALLRMPDLDQFGSLAASSYEILQWQAEQMLVRGKEVKPRKYADHALGLEFMTAALQRAEMQGAPAERRELLERWIEKADEFAAEAQAAQAPPPSGDMTGGPQMMQQLPPGAA